MQPTHFEKWSELSHVLSHQRGWISKDERIELSLRCLVASDEESAGYLLTIRERAQLVDLEISARDFVSAYRNTLHVPDTLDPSVFSSKQIFREMKSCLAEYSRNAEKQLFRHIPRLVGFNYENIFSDIPPRNMINLRHFVALIPTLNFQVSQIITRPELGVVSFFRRRFRGIIDFTRGCVTLVQPEFSEIFLVEKTMVRVNAARDRIELIRDRLGIVTNDGSGIHVLSFTASPSKDQLYLVYKTSNSLFLLVCPKFAGDCQLLEPDDSFNFVEMDGDFMFARTPDSSYLISLAENSLYSTRYPDRRHVPDLKIMSFPGSYVVKDVTQLRVEAFFRFICQIHAERISASVSLEGKEISRICESHRWSLIEKFLTGKPYSEVALSIMIQKILML